MKPCTSMLMMMVVTLAMAATVALATAVAGADAASTAPTAASSTPAATALLDGADAAVSAATDAGAGQLEAVDPAFAPKGGSPGCANATALWTWPGEAFQPNQAKTYIAGSGCPGGVAPTGCGCSNGELNVPVLAQQLVTTRTVPAGGSCLCTYYLPAGFPPSAGFTIRVQNVCPR